MTAPGGGFGESAHDNEANQAPARDRTPQPPAWEVPGAGPSSSPAADYAPQAPSVYPSYPSPGYPTDYQTGYPAQYPPPMSPPPEYPHPPGYGGPQYPPGYGGPQYPPAPPQFGGPPPGYGPAYYPGHPGGAGEGYYPTPDYPGGYGPAQPGMNGLAVGSLIASLTGFLCCIGGFVGIVLGMIALDQVKRTRQDGFALAVAGIVIGVASLIVSLIVGIFALHSR